jgi:hypothetical protein
MVDYEILRQYNVFSILINITYLVTSISNYTDYVDKRHRTRWALFGLIIHALSGSINLTFSSIMIIMNRLNGFIITQDLVYILKVMQFCHSLGGYLMLKRLPGSIRLTRPGYFISLCWLIYLVTNITSQMDFEVYYGYFSMGGYVRLLYWTFIAFGIRKESRYDLSTLIAHVFTSMISLGIIGPISGFITIILYNTYWYFTLKWNDDNISNYIDHVTPCEYFLALAPFQRINPN